MRPVLLSFAAAVTALTVSHWSAFTNWRHPTAVLVDPQRAGSNDLAIYNVYREHIGDDRLHAVVEHVRTWLYAPTEGE